MTLPEYVPADVLADLRSHLIAGVANAQADHSSAGGSEDSLTGALGTWLQLGNLKGVHTSSGDWGYRITWRKFRSARGRSREERVIGADGIVQFEVFRGYGTDVYTKGLLFQAKHEGDWSARLKNQCEQMLHVAPEAGAVFRFGPDAYTAMDATEVLHAWSDHSSRTRQPVRPGQQLGEYLADRFLGCTVGIERLFYDHDGNTLFVPDPARAYNRISVPLNKLTIQVFNPQAIQDVVASRAVRGRRS